jgi:hypothetical protein
LSDREAARIERLLREAVGRCGGDERLWRHFLNGLTEPVRRGLIEGWRWQAHKGQREPAGNWNVWLLMAGRGFGKTRAGAEWISEMARQAGTPNRDVPVRIALVGGSLDEVAKVMIEGPSGLLRVARTGEAVSWKPSLGTLTFANGAQTFAYSAAAPEALRGPEHHFAWCDELAKWHPKRADAAWDNLMMGLRLGERPRMMVTTTPKHTLAGAGARARGGGRDPGNDARQYASAGRVRRLDAGDVRRDAARAAGARRRIYRGC